MVSAPTTAPASDRAPTSGQTSQHARTRETGETDPDTPGFALRLGDAITSIALEGDGVQRTRRGYDIDLAGRNLSLPGIHFTRLQLRSGAGGEPQSGTLHGNVRAPFVSGDVELRVDAQGGLSGGARLTADIGLLGDPVVTFSYEDREWQGELDLSGGDIPLPIPRVQIEEGRARISYRGDHLNGSLSATFHHAALGEGDINVTLDNDTIAGSGGFTLSVPLLNESRGTFDYTDGDLSAALDLSAGAIETPVPGLSVDRASGQLHLAGGRISGNASLEAAYAGLAVVTLDDVEFRDSGFGRASGTLRVTAPPIDGIEGNVTFTPRGQVTGSLTIPQGDIPIPALSRGRITVTLREDGGIDVGGRGTITVGPGSGDLRLDWEDGKLTLGADVLLRVPPLDEARGSFEYEDGQLQGEAGADVSIGALSGTVVLRYWDEQFSGEGRVDYSVGRFEGWVLVIVDPESNISGEGEASVALTDSLVGTIGLAIDPELNVDARGELVFGDEIVLFRPWEYERNFFSVEQDIPLWGISIPVVGSIGLVAEIGATAGFRANFGPGVFRNIRAEGELSTRPEVEPSFSITGDIHIPAGAEIVVAVNGGLGLSALVAKLSGGVEVQGIAGIYGAITLSPTFEYADGDYTIRGDALLEAAAQLAARVNAYARVRAGVGRLSREVWREDWRLAEWRFDPGWSIGLRAGIAYTLGEPFEPEISYEPVTVDPQALARGAVPRSGEPVSAPARPPAPAASFTPDEGEVDATADPAEGASAPTGGEAGPAGAETPPGPDAPTEAEVEADIAVPPPGPQVGPPAAMGTPAEERTLDESYLAYRYDQLQLALMRRARPGAVTLEDLEPDDAGDERETPPVPATEASPGRPLPPEQRERLESIFGADLSAVRVHDDAAAHEATERVDAEAFTVGDDIYFGADRPVLDDEDPLLIHEVTHVVQGANGSLGTEGVSEPGDELEREAEEAAEAVRRGERPAPIRHRPGPAIRRQASAAAEPGGSREPLSEESWRRIEAEFGDHPVIGRVVRNLHAREDFHARMKSEVYSTERHELTLRPFVPLVWPGPGALAHRNVFGERLIEPRDVLIRHQAERDDSGAQSALARLIREESAFPEHEVGTRELPDPSEAWSAYQNHPKRIRALAEGALEQTNYLLTRADQQTSESVHNLTLNSTAFGRLWGRGYTFFPRGPNGAQGGTWRLTHPGGRVAATASGATPDPGTVRRMTQDYQAHHVIPLWLRSAMGKADGDHMRNLVPWHHAAHQSNHGVHQRAPENVRDTTGVTSYYDFPDRTQFRIHEIVPGSRSHPTGSAVPQFNLVRDGSSYRWQPGVPLWAP